MYHISHLSSSLRPEITRTTALAATVIMHLRQTPPSRGCDERDRKPSGIIIYVYKPRSAPGPETLTGNANDRVNSNDNDIFSSTVPALDPRKLMVYAEEPHIHTHAHVIIYEMSKTLRVTRRTILVNPLLLLSLLLLPLRCL